MNKLTHEQFNKMWEDSTKEEVLFQFYYDYYAKVEALDKIDKAIEYIENNCLWEENEGKEVEYAVANDSKARKELLSILRGEIMKIFKTKKQKIKEECWNLDHELVKWLNQHLKVYLEDASKIVDLTYRKYIYKKKTMTQVQIIKRLIEITDTLLGDENNDYWELTWSSNIIVDLVNEMYDLLKLVHFALWW